ncbi:MAG: NADH-quinone oxidoreductase subunit L [Burkholderiaceae bacterium]|jgi:NADH-quinone oxidoreductase subunit L|nr:NADH-quinone oxidoreductase subunit L [Burkholderiaceae bacterium]
MHALTLIVILPLVGFLINGLAGNRLGQRAVSVIGCGLPIISFAITVAMFVLLMRSGEPRIEIAYTWATIGKTSFEIALYFDRLSAVMTLIVTGIGSLIHIYSIGYMKEDASFARFFAYLNLFLFFMLMLVLGRSLLVMFVGWEGVGLASYLLIGFWFEDPVNAKAGKKAFITNRVGDAGFLIGMFLLYNAFGTLDMDRINAAFMAGPVAVSASLVGVFLFIGATGKSAQIPLHVWLPDAMAGPTPVSALIHAATMVTAGVYMIARLNGVYLHAPEASALVAWIGAMTAFFAATVAIVQTDIKKVLAYSTVSQLGFMFVALGVGAYGVAVFHLLTHAFFKACLFLGAGSVIHALSGEQDIRKMGGLRKRIPITFWTFAIATGAIAGLPPLSGFFSKDEILWFALASERGGSVLLMVVMAVTALMTAFYMFRLLWLTFMGASRMDHEVEHHVHESPFSMTGVLMVLALLAAVGGFIPVPHFLEPVAPLPATRESMHALHVPLVGLAIALGVIGLLAAAFVYRGKAELATWFRTSFDGLHRLLSGKYFIDELYDSLIQRPLLWISERVFLNFGDRRLFDGTLHGMAGVANASGGVLSRVQTGSLHLYVLLVLIGSFLALVWSWAHG